MWKKRRCDDKFSMRDSIDRLFKLGDEVEAEFRELESNSAANRASRATTSSNEEEKKSGPFLIISLNRLNGSFLKSRDIADLAHYSLFGSSIPKPKWAMFKNSRKVLQTLVVRVNCPTELIESTSLPFLDEFFNRVWYQTDSDVTSRELFWKDMLNVSITVAEQIKEKVKKVEKRQKKNGIADRLGYLMSLGEMAESSYPFPGDEDIIPTKKRYLPISPSSPLLSVDCEMCFTSAMCHELTRISIVDEQGKILLDTLVKPKNGITDYLTQYSGITEEMLENVETRLEDVQKAVKAILGPDAILVGHSLEYDLRAMRMAHPYCIDAAVVLNFSGGRATMKNSLKTLADVFLDEQIQTQFGHCSYEDAWATMRLVQLKMEKGLVFGNVRFGWNYKQFLNSKEEKVEVPAKRSKIEKSETPSNCTKCNQPTIVNCTVTNCECQFSAGPSVCVLCYKDSESVEGDFDWEDSLHIDSSVKTRPIENYLKKDKHSSMMCAIKHEVTTTFKRIRIKKVENFKTTDRFVQSCAAEVMNHNLNLIELDYEDIAEEEEAVETEEGEIAGSERVLNSHIQKLIQATANNSLVMLVLASDTKSVFYVRLKN